MQQLRQVCRRPGGNDRQKGFIKFPCPTQSFCPKDRIRLAGTAKLPYKLCKSFLFLRRPGQQGISCLPAQVVVGEHLKRRDLRDEVGAK